MFGVAQSDLCSWCVFSSVDPLNTQRFGDLRNSARASTISNLFTPKSLAFRSKRLGSHFRCSWVGLGSSPAWVAWVKIHHFGGVKPYPHLFFWVNRLINHFEPECHRMPQMSPSFHPLLGKYLQLRLGWYGCLGCCDTATSQGFLCGWRCHLLCQLDVDGCWWFGGRVLPLGSKKSRGKCGCKHRTYGSLRSLKKEPLFLGGQSWCPLFQGALTNKIKQVFNLLWVDGG